MGDSMKWTKDVIIAELVGVFTSFRWLYWCFIKMYMRIPGWK